MSYQTSSECVVTVIFPLERGLRQTAVFPSVLLFYAFP